MNTYTKLKDGSWGLHVEGSSPGVGTHVTVTKKDGTVNQEIIARVLWTGTDKKTGKTVHLCSIAQKPTTQPRTRRGGTRTGCSCGSVEEYSKDSDCWTCRHDA